MTETVMDLSHQWITPLLAEPLHFNRRFLSGLRRCNDRSTVGFLFCF